MWGISGVPGGERSDYKLWINENMISVFYLQGISDRVTASAAKANW